MGTSRVSQCGLQTVSRVTRPNLLRVDVDKDEWDTRVELIPCCERPTLMLARVNSNLHPCLPLIDINYRRETRHDSITLSYLHNMTPL